MRATLLVGRRHDTLGSDHLPVGIRLVDRLPHLAGHRLGPRVEDVGRALMDRVDRQAGRGPFHIAYLHSGRGRPGVPLFGRCQWAMWLSRRHRSPRHNWRRHDAWRCRAGWLGENHAVRPTGARPTSRRRGCGTTSLHHSRQALHHRRAHVYRWRQGGRRVIGVYITGGPEHRRRPDPHRRGRQQQPAEQNDVHHPQMSFRKDCLAVFSVICRIVPGGYNVIYRAAAASNAFESESLPWC